MKKLSFLLFLALFLFKNNVFGQKSSELSKTTYFKSGSAELDEVAKTNLLELVAAIKMATSYEISIDAYTDTDGSNSFNQELSSQRANSVRTFLQQNGIDLTYTESQSFGEEKSTFEKQIEDEKAKNRRVETKVKTFSFENLEQFFANSSQKNRETFVINNQKDTILYATQGTIVSIPANVFEFENGKKPSGEVKFKIIEAYDYSDMIMNDLHTGTENALLETGGMIFLEAESDNQKLRLTDGKELKVSLSSKKEVKKDMELFYGQHTENANLNSISPNPKKKLFSWLRAGKRPSFKPLDGDENCIKGIDRSCLKKVVFSKPNHNVNLLPEYRKVIEPKEPQKPVLPAAAKEPQKPSILLQDYAKLSRKEKKSYKNQEIEYNARLVSFNDQMTRYIKRKEAYAAQLDNYNNVLIPKYLSEKAKFEVKINEIADAIMKMTMSNADVDIYNFLMKRKAYLSKVCIENEIQISNFDRELGSYFIGEYNSNHSKQFKGKIFQEYINFFGAEIAEKYFKFSNTDVKHLLSEKDTIEMSERIHSKPVFYYEDYLAEKARLIANSNSENSLLTAVKAINQQIKDIYLQEQKDLRAGKGSAKVVSSYVFGVAKLGWINCDRFTNYPESEKMFVNIKTNSNENDEKVFMVFDKIKSVIALQKTTTNSWASLFVVPRQEPAVLVAIKHSEGKTYLGFLKTTPQNADFQKISYEKLNSIQELNQKLKSLNII